MADPQPTDAHLRIAYSIQEQLMISDFTKRQRKILDLILRLSWGCQKKDAYIPHHRDFEIVGVYETDINKELNYLVNCKVISIDGDRYSFNKDFDQWRISLAYTFTPEKLGKLLSINLQELSKTLSNNKENLVKHKEKTLYNTKFVTHELGVLKTSNKEDTIKEYINLDNITDPISKEIWENCLLELSAQVSKNNYNTWLAGTTGIQNNGDGFIVGCPSENIAMYLDGHMKSLIEKVTSGVLGRESRVIFAVNRETE